MRVRYKIVTVFMILLFISATINASANGHILGVKFFDCNGDGNFDPDEKSCVLPGWTIELLQNGVVIDTRQTDELGEYRFLNLPDGTYTVREIQKPGYISTTPASQTVVITPYVAPAIIYLAGDAEATALLPANHIAVVTESRIGDRGGAATFELDINTPFPSLNIRAQSNFNWVSGVTYPFTIQYIPGTSTIRYTVGGVPISWASVPAVPSIDGFLVRTRAAITNSRIDLTGMTLTPVVGTAQPLPDSIAVADSVTNYYVQGDLLTTGDLSQGFTITGNQRLTWDPSQVPRQSQLACQFKFGPPEIDPPDSVYIVDFGNTLEDKPTYRQTVDDTLTTGATSFGCTNETALFASPGLSYGAAFPCFPEIMPCVGTTPCVSPIQAGSSFSPDLTGELGGGIKKQLRFSPFSGCTVGGPAAVTFGFPVIAQSGQSTAFNSAFASAVDSETLDFDFLEFAQINRGLLGATLTALYLVLR